jgi:hypothetical protein
MIRLFVEYLIPQELDMSYLKKRTGIFPERTFPKDLILGNDLFSC